MFGQGLVKGLSITIKRFFKKNITMQYPEVKPKLPARSHGSFDFSAEKCIACGLCANACPNGVIKVDTNKDEKGKKYIEDYRINLGYCLFCGMCIEACPTAALTSKPDFELASGCKGDMCLHWKGNVKKEEKNTASTAVDETASMQ